MFLKKSIKNFLITKPLQVLKATLPQDQRFMGLGALEKAGTDSPLGYTWINESVENLGSIFLGPIIQPHTHLIKLFPESRNLSTFGSNFILANSPKLESLKYFMPLNCGMQLNFTVYHPKFLNVYKAYLLNTSIGRSQDVPSLNVNFSNFAKMGDLN